jgi:peptide/nickel transport system substrate-binding protein
VKRRTFIKSSGALIGAGAFYPWIPAFADKANDTLVWALDVELKSLDQYYTSTRTGLILAHHIWDGLIYRDPQTLEYKPLLATAWEWIDNVTLDVDLRKGVVFHNRQPFTADDVVYTLNYASNPENHVVLYQAVSWIKKAEKLDNYKARIHLKKPYPPALDYLSLIIPMYPKEYYASVGPKGMSDHPIGTGPYKVTKVKSLSDVDLEKNTNYFENSPKGKPSIGKLTFRVIPDKSTQLAQLLSGDLDWAWRVPVDRAKQLKNMPSVTVKSGDTMRIGYLGFDSAGRTGKKNNPFIDERVRKAFMYALDRKAMADIIWGGTSKVPNSICSPSQFGCTQDVTTYSHDPEKAKKLLEEAGYPNGLDIDLYAYSYRPYAEAMINYLRKVGIHARLRMLSYSSLRDKVRNGEVACYFMTWGSNSVNDASAILDVFFTGDKDDTTRDKQVIEWLKQADVEMDKDKRKALYKKALQRIAEKVYWIPLYTYSVFYAFDKDLKFTPSRDGIPRFFNANWK